MAEVVTMPRLSDTMEEGTVAKWLKKVGDKVEEGEDKDPNKVDKVPVKTYFFYHFVVSASLVCSDDYVKEDDAIDDHSRENVKAVEARNKEKEICEKTVSIFVVNEVGSFHDVNRIVDFRQ